MMLTRTQRSALSAVAILGWVVGCDGDDAAPSTALVNVVQEEAGKNCEAGGQRIETGVDRDGDGRLSSDEVAHTNFACNGVPGADGTEGARGEDGADGVSGTDGANGIDGADGTNGADGEKGADGKLALVAVVSEPSGSNCPIGGEKISVGLDADDSGVLDEQEVQSSFYLCQGKEGFSSLVDTAAEPPGENCVSGGQKVSHGIDLDRDGILDANEVEGAPVFVCNGVVGATGAVSLALVSNEPAGPNCSAGGKRVVTGVDADGSGTLVGSEIAATNYVCNGADGFSTLVTTEAITAPCASGGQRLSIGLDNGDALGIARNGILEAGEVDKTINLCNGADGADGVDGKDGQGGVHMFDATGFDLGRLANLNSGFLGPGNTTLLSETGYLYSLEYDMSYQSQVVYFSNNNCTGDTFAPSPLQYSSSNAFGGKFGVYIDGVGWFESVANSYTSSSSYGSYRYSGSGCQAQGGTFAGYRVTSSSAATIGVPLGDSPALPITVGAPAELLP